MAEEDNSNDDLDGKIGKVKELTTLTDKLGKTISKSFASGIASGKGFDDILRGLGQRLIDVGLRAAFKPLEQLASKSLSGLFDNVMSSFNSNAAIASAPVNYFADGGVISSPAYFPLGGGLGLAGEAGPEAIMPLTRGPDGRLGVANHGGGGTNVTVNIATPDVASFRGADAQISATLARAVARGQRSL